MGLLNSESEFGMIQIIQLVLLTFPCCLFVYGINDIYDYKSDRINPRKKLLEGVKLSPKHHSLIKSSSIICMAFLAASSVITLNIGNLLSVLLFLFLSYSYSAPPLRLKERPPLDSFANAAIILSAFAMGYSFGGSIFEIPAKWYLIGFAIMGIHAFSTIMDYTADKKSNQKTFSTVFGKRAASLFALFSFVVTIFFAELSNFTTFISAIYSAMFLIMIFVPSENLSRIFFKIGYAGFILITTNIVINVIGIV